MPNPSGIEPCGYRLVVKPEALETVSKGGIILFTPTQEEKEAIAQVYGRVVAVGAECWQPSTPIGWLRRFCGLEPRWARPGDRIIFGKYSGLIFPGADGTKYRVINDRDVVAVVPQP
jgi:co-chaperonin GroES (HSP10)